MLVREIFRVPMVPSIQEVGLEIEMEGRNVHTMRHIRNKWKGVEDHSLRGNSVEWVLPRPIQRQSVRERLRILKKAVAKKTIVKLNPSDRCGVHVHINCQAMQEEELFKFITLYLMFEELIVHWCGDRREGNMFCYRACDAEELVFELTSVRRNGYWGAITNDNFRYAALNVSSLSKYGSLEFRAMQTPTDLLEIATWVDVLLALKDFSMRSADCAEMVMGISAEGYGPFAQQVLGNKLMEIFWPGPNGQAMMVNGVRLAQQIAFTERQEPQEIERGAG